MKLKRGDKVRIIAGKDKGKEGKILVVDRKTNRVIVEGLNMMKKHTKPSQQDQKGGIVKKEAPISVSNVMYLHKGKPVRIGFKVTLDEKGKVTEKVRVARPSGEVID